MLLKSMKKEATDRFRRDTILLCNWTKWFVVLHHTMNNERPVVSRKTVLRVFWPWSPFATHRRRASVRCFVVSEHVLYLQIQFARRGQEEGENW
jgi:hypothetical protein